MVIGRRYPVDFSPMAKSKDASETPIQMSFLEPMECLLVSKLPEGPEWAYEIKLDGIAPRHFATARPLSSSRAMETIWAYASRQWSAV